jgi:hypothetical protein
MSSKASSRSDEEVLVTGDLADVPIVTVTTELPVHVAQAASNEAGQEVVAAAAPVTAAATEVAATEVAATEVAANSTAESIPATTSETVIGTAEATAETTAEATATATASAEDAGETAAVIAAAPTDEVVSSPAIEASIPASDEINSATADEVTTAAAATTEPAIEAVTAPPSAAITETKAEASTDDEISAVAQDATTTETTQTTARIQMPETSPPVDDELANLVSALAAAQGEQPEQHHLMTSALLAGTAPRSFVSSASGAGGETLADHSAEPSTVLDATDLVIEADTEKETGVRRVPSPRSTMVGMPAFVNTPPIPADENFLRNVVLPQPSRPTGRTSVVTASSTGSMPITTAADAGSEEHTVISPAPSPALLATMAAPTSQDALSQFATLAPRKKTVGAGWRTTVTEKRVPLSYLQIGGMLVGALFLGGTGNALFSGPATPVQADTPPIATDRAVVTPLPPPRSATAVVERTTPPPPANTAVIAPITRPTPPAAALPTEGSDQQDKASTKRVRRLKRLAAKPATGKTWVDPFE